MMIKKQKIIIVLLIMTSTLFAHEGHKKKNETPVYDTLTIVNGDTIAINGTAREHTILNHANIDKPKIDIPEEEIENKSITFISAFEHMHNKLIHYPIAITFVAFFLMLIGYKDNKYENALKIIIPFAAVVSIAAIVSGLSQAHVFEGTEVYKLVETHELLGFGVFASLVLWSLSLYLKSFRKFVWLFAALTFLLVAIAGLYGGVIAH